ncbi:DUF1488 domain-containing protein [Paraburkholderia sp. RL17-373-BIF-A]
MRITFPHTTPEYRGSNLTVGFDAQVDGKSIDCAISAEALEDHFGAASPSSTDLLDAFNHHRAEIENTARNLLHVVDTKQLLLHSGHFRVSLSGRSDCV